MKRSIATAACVWAVLIAAGLRADVQGRLNVVAHALAAANHIQIHVVAVTGFTDAASGQRTPFADTLEADLRSALAANKHWQVVKAGDKATVPDALVTGNYERSADTVQVQVEVLAQPEGTLLWQRLAVIDGADVDANALPAAPAAAEGQAPVAQDSGPLPGSQIPGNTVPGTEGPGNQVPYAGADGAYEHQTIPTLPYRRHRPWRDWGDYHWDFSIAYKAFFPTNSTFQNAAGNRQDGISLGFNFNDVVLWDADFWSQNVTNVGTVQSLNYAGTSVALVYPIHAGPFTFYLGPGGRFGTINVNDPGINANTGFGNNALTAVAGGKWTFGPVGLDLRYTYDLASSYTGFNTVRAGAFYEWR
jgi:hypothetical protein